MKLIYNNKLFQNEIFTFPKRKLTKYLSYLSQKELTLILFKVMNFLSINK